MSDIEIVDIDDMDMEVVQEDPIIVAQDMNITIPITDLEKTITVVGIDDNDTSIVSVDDSDKDVKKRTLRKAGNTGGKAPHVAVSFKPIRKTAEPPPEDNVRRMNLRSSNNNKPSKKAKNVECFDVNSDSDDSSSDDDDDIQVLDDPNDINDPDLEEITASGEVATDGFCDLCGLYLDSINDIEKHHEVVHKIVLCKWCTKKVTLSKIRSHIATNCTKFVKILGSHCSIHDKMETDEMLEMEEFRNCRPWSCDACGQRYDKNSLMEAAEIADTFVCPGCLHGRVRGIEHRAGDGGKTIEEVSLDEETDAAPEITEASKTSNHVIMENNSILITRTVDVEEIVSVRSSEDVVVSENDSKEIVLAVLSSILGDILKPQNEDVSDVSETEDSTESPAEMTPTKNSIEEVSNTEKDDVEHKEVENEKQNEISIEPSKKGDGNHEEIEVLNTEDKESVNEIEDAANQHEIITETGDSGKNIDASLEVINIVSNSVNPVRNEEEDCDDKIGKADDDASKPSEVTFDIPSGDEDQKNIVEVTLDKEEAATVSNTSQTEESLPLPPSPVKRVARKSTKPPQHPQPPPTDQEMVMAEEERRREKRKLDSLSPSSPAKVPRQEEEITSSEVCEDSAAAAEATTVTLDDTHDDGEEADSVIAEPDLVTLDDEESTECVTIDDVESTEYVTQVNLDDYTNDPVKKDVVTLDDEEPVNDASKSLAVQDIVDLDEENTSEKKKESSPLSSPIKKVARKSTKPPQNPQPAPTDEEMLMVEEKSRPEKRKIESPKSASPKKVARKSTKPPIAPQVLNFMFVNESSDEDVIKYSKNEAEDELNTSVLLASPARDDDSSDIEEITIC